MPVSIASWAARRTWRGISVSQTAWERLTPPTRSHSTDMIRISDCVMTSARSLSLRVMVYLTLSSSEKAPNASNRLFDMLVGGLSAHRQRDDLPTDRLGFGKMVVAQLQTRMMPHRRWPADQGFDSILLQPRPQIVTPRGSDHIVLIDILALVASEVRKHNLCDIP